MLGSRRVTARMISPTTPAAALPATAPIPCLHCRRENPPGRRFCGGCGQSLWEKCPRCGVECPADERFCGGCGADVAETRNEELRQCEARIAEALELKESHQYDAAIASLRSVAVMTDPRFETFAARAVAELENVERQRVAALASAQATLDLAKQLFADHAYERAQHALEKIPESLRTDEQRDLLARTQSCRREISTLLDEIRAAIDERRTADVLLSLERLLTLKPNHGQALQLAHQIRDNRLKAAKARLSQHQYQEAFEQLQQIPSVASNQDVETLLDTAGELACLMSAVENAPLAEPQAVALAQRLCKLAPANAKAAQLRDSLRERVKNKPPGPRLRAANWAPVPQQTWLDAPVDELSFFSKVSAANDDIAKVLTEHPGHFFTALGLALQGLGLAAIDADLTPAERSSGLARLSAINLGRRPPAAAWGLDLSDSALKAVRLARVGKEGLKIDRAEHLAHRQLLANASDDLARAEVVNETLCDFAALAGDVKGTPVCIGLPGQRVLGRLFDLPPMPARKVLDSVQYEARHQLPISLDELCWSHFVLDAIDGKGADDQPRRLLVQAARDSQVRDRVGRFKAAGIAVDCVQSDCVALHNALVFEFFQVPEEAHACGGAIAAVEIGATSSNVVISAPRHVWFRSFGTGGDDFIRELMRQFQLTAEQAHELLREPARARRYHRWAQATEPLAAQLADEVRRSLTTYNKSCPDHPVRHVYALGEGLQSLVLRFLRTGN
jgi:Tfp pilus assembly PilM family ATPase